MAERSAMLLLNTRERGAEKRHRLSDAGLFVTKTPQQRCTDV